MQSREINLITGNANKVADVKAILEPQGFVVKSRALDIPEIQETIKKITTTKYHKAAEIGCDSFYRYKRKK